MVRCMTSMTNGSHLRANSLKKILQEANMTTALDADMEMDNAVPLLFCRIISSNSVHNVHYMKTRIRRSQHSTKDEDLFIESIKQALCFNKVAVCCQEKKRALM